MLASPTRLEPGQRVVERHVANDVLRVRVPVPREVIGMCVLRSDVEGLEPMESDELPAVVEERRRRLGFREQRLRALQQVFPHVTDLELVRRAVVQHRRPREADHLIARVVLMPGGIGNRQVVLDRIVHRQDPLTRPAETERVVAVHLVIEPQEAVGPGEIGRRGVRNR